MYTSVAFHKQGGSVGKRLYYVVVWMSGETGDITVGEIIKLGGGRLGDCQLSIFCMSGETPDIT